jgi:peptide/nickel transport system substrate-binding protein
VAGGVIRVASQKPAGPLDPVGMQDLASYGIVAQSFEFLASLGEAGDIGPGLAESWESNDDGSVWTFNLRQGVKWQDGSDFTAADVAATMDRLVEYGNSGLKGVIDLGAVDASDPTKAVFTLVSPNGLFPYLVSVYNAQTVITPVDFVLGSTADGSPNGTGPFRLVSFDAATGATFERNPDWWGGATPLDGSVWSFFDDEGAMVTATSAGEVDAIVQFQVVGGDALFNNPDFNTVISRNTTHRQIWMRCDEGQFADKRVRQALALSIDREALIATLFQGKADIANDHVIAPLYPFFDPTQPQRTRDLAAAMALLADAGKTGMTAVLHFAELQEIPELAQLIKQQAADAGIELELAGESLDTFYGSQWCPTDPADPPCSGAAELGIVDYGHRAVPDVYLNAALKTNGVWNSSQYSSGEFDAAFGAYQAATTIDAHKAPAAELQRILTEDTPVIVPYFYNFISGHWKTFQNVRSSALGQMFLAEASKA